MEKKFTEELKRTRKNHQFSDYSVNNCTGCGNKCKYCYGCSMATYFQGLDPKNWENEVIRPHDLKKKIKKFPSIVMYPSSHDIRPIHLKESIQMLEKILKVGNDVLIVSKPHFECISKICETFTDYKNQILFRFTIGSTDSEVLKFWETNAPSFEERFESLKYCFNQKWNTSISAEPILSKNVQELITKLSPFVTESIWIGPAQQLKKRLSTNGHGDPITLQKADELEKWQFDPQFIQHLYDTYKDLSLIHI